MVYINIRKSIYSKLNPITLFQRHLNNDNFDSVEVPTGTLENGYID